MTADAFALIGIDAVEFYVGNARQAAQVYRSLGFTPIAYRGLETGSRDITSWCVAQGDVRFIFTAALRPGHEVAEHVALHGDGVRDVALAVADVATAYEHALSQGARPIREPEEIEDDNGPVITAAIGTYGEVIHSLVQRDGYSGPYLPGFAAVEDCDTADGALGIYGIDHIVAAVQRGDMDAWVQYYRDVMGFSQLQRFSDAQISTEYSALMSKVVWDQKRVKFPICEPAAGRRASQIEEFLDFYGSPGVQHIALLTDSIVDTSKAMRRTGTEFLHIPDSYYDELPGRVPELTYEVERLREARVLVDHDEDGHLLQIFSRTLQDRPTFFVELVERHGARGFGEGNFQALFEALEAEQALRGNL